MLTTKLTDLLPKGDPVKVFASMTKENFANRELEKFDRNLSQLCGELRNLVPSVNFNFNSSSEKYEISLPQMDQVTAQKVTDLLSQAELSITADYHFGDLF